MFDQVLFFFNALLQQTGAANFTWGNLVMMIIGGTMIYLAIAKHYEPLLLIGIGFSCIVANVPGPPDVPGGPPVSALLYVVKEGGLFHYRHPKPVVEVARASCPCLAHGQDARATINSTT